MKDVNESMPDRVDESRRNLLKAVAWAAPFCGASGMVRLAYGGTGEGIAQGVSEEASKLGARCRRAYPEGGI